jgi:hypothetical protein
MTHIYDKNLNGEIHPCEACGRAGQNVQHHVGGRRYDDRAIWVCNLCHQKIHNPTSFDLPSSWAYDNGYLLRRSNTMVKEKKTKTCTHSASYYNAKKGFMVCNFCGKQVEELKFGTAKKAEPYKKHTGKKYGTDISVTTKPRMGQEKQDPRIAQAEKLKVERNSLLLKMKTEKDPVKRADYQVRMAGVINQMKALQKTYND